MFPLSPLLGWSFLMSYVCVYVCSPREEPRSRTQTDTQMLPIELYPQWVCVSRWALSFLTRRESSTGGWREDGWREGDGCCSGPLKRRDGPCGAWTTASFRCRFSLPVSVFSSFIFFHSSGSNVPFYSSLLPSRFLLRGLASFCLLALEVQSNKKPLKPGTTPTLCLHSSH